MPNYVDKYVLTQALIALAILLATPFTRFNFFAIQVIGVALLIIGFVVLIISIKQLGPAMTPVVTPKEKAKLVTLGIYNIVRHPLYSGVILLAIGWSLFWESLLSLLFSFILILFFEFKTNKEEVLLTEKYPEYSDYKARVRKKIIPFIY